MYVCTVHTRVRTQVCKNEATNYLVVRFFHSYSKVPRFQGTWTLNYYDGIFVKTNKKYKCSTAGTQQSPCREAQVTSSNAPSSTHRHLLGRTTTTNCALQQTQLDPTSHQDPDPLFSLAPCLPPTNCSATSYRTRWAWVVPDTLPLAPPADSTHLRFRWSRRKRDRTKDDSRSSTLDSL